MIPRFNIKRIKNRLVGNTRWTDYVPTPIQFPQDTLSPGKYVVEVNDGTGYHIDTDAFDDFREFYDKTQPGPSFDEKFAGVTAGQIQPTEKDFNGDPIVYDFITFYRDYAYDRQLSSFVDDLTYKDDYDEEVPSIECLIKGKVIVSDQRDGTLYVMLQDHRGDDTAVKLIKSEDDSLVATSVMPVIATAEIIDNATVWTDNWQNTEVTFLIPEYVFNEWNGVTDYPLIFEGMWSIMDEAWYEISEPEVKKFSILDDSDSFAYEVMIRGYIEWEESPDSFRIEIEVTPETLNRWRSILQAMREPTKYINLGEYFATLDVRRI